MMNQTVKRNLISLMELKILRSLTERRPGGEDTKEVGEIAILSGIKDNDEVLRALYTLEGKSLVRPEPAGDFTSDYWKITDIGMKALTLTPVEMQ